MPGKDTNTGGKRAREVRAELGLADAEPATCLLSRVEQQLAIPVVVAALPAGVAGCCWRDGKRTVLWVNGTEPAARQRFTLSHELGHVRCRHDLGVPVETIETLGGKSTDSREVQANAFAAELLAPAAGVRAMLEREPTLEDVVLIAARYGISTIAALYRLNSLALTSRYVGLKAELDDGLDADVVQRLSPHPIDDEIAVLGNSKLPRVSPLLAGSALTAALAGSVSISEAAGACGCDPEMLADGTALIGL